MQKSFDVQGFGALSEWNGQFSSTSATDAFQTMATLGANSTELTARIWTPNGNSDQVLADAATTESDASLLAGFQAAHAAGLSVVFKAALSSFDHTPSYSLAPTDVRAFFASYQAEIVHLASIAQSAGVETFDIGNEMGSLSGAQYLPYWTDLINAVRSVYQGQLTYSAAMDEASKVGFWGQLDTIGVNAYPSLTANSSPTVQDLVHAWNSVPVNPYYASAFEYRSPVDFLHTLSEQFGKQVLMTEVGYRSIDGTAIDPSVWGTTGAENDSSQADAYNAFFQVWSAQGGSWFKGAELWQWDLNNQFSPTGYSVMGKPAEAVVSSYFHGTGYVPKLAVTASAIADVIDVGNGGASIQAGLGNDVIFGGSGNDTIVAGPSSVGPLTSTTITLTGYGSIVNGVGAQAQVMVNGKAVSGLLEFKPALDPSGYQTYTISFPNAGVISSLDIGLYNASPGRALHLKEISINGVELHPADATNNSAPGSFDLYVFSIHVDTTNHQDWFYGSATDNDTVYGGPGNDTITGGAGNDVIDGGDGIDTAVYAGNVADYRIEFNGDQILVSDGVSNRDGSDQLTNIEFLRFADTTLDVARLRSGAGVLAAGDRLQVQAVDSAGAPTMEVIAHADGSRDVYTYGEVGKPYSSEHDLVAANGLTILREQFRSDSTLYYKQVTDPNGVTTFDQYDQAGHLVQGIVKASDGSSQQFTYDSSGNVVSETIAHLDGTRDVYDYGIAGKSFTSQHTMTDASGHSVLVEQFHLDGTLFYRQATDSSGVTNFDQYDQAGHLVQETVKASDGSSHLFTYGSSGNVVKETIAHLDGTRDVYDYGIAGKSYTSQHTTTDASGHSVLVEQFHFDGTLFYRQATDSSGVTNFDQYDQAGHLVQETVKASDGSSQLFSYGSNGNVVKETITHLDGTRDVYDYGIAGKSYTSQHTTIDSSGHSVLVEQFHSDGTLSYRQATDSNGSTTFDQYDQAGHLTQELVKASNGSFDQFVFDEQGNLAKETAQHLDGTREVDTFYAPGNPYLARHDALDAQGLTIQTTVDYAAGGHVMTANVAGTAIVASSGNDVMNSAGGDTFVFKMAAGIHQINHFLVGDAPEHDVLQISKSIATDVSQLNMHLSDQGMVIDLGHNATILLAGISINPTAHDFLFV
ncbi:Ca2+-binding RTX toxin-like protein [Bradyrhizobium sp. USDA 4449]